MATRLLPGLPAVSVAATLLLAACGGGDRVAEPDAGARAFVERLAADRPTARILSVAPGVDAEALLDWAQWKFPTLFPPGATTIDLQYQGVAYAVRAYPGGNYLGVSRQGEVWGLGGFTGGVLESFGPVAQYAAMVQADRCQVYPAGCAAPGPLDTELRRLIARHGLLGDPTVGRELPHIADALPQLGKLLFFSKSLSAARDTACASCHHPTLGGGDGLGIPIGTGAAQPDLVGPGRRRADGHLFVQRNANTFFNIALYDRVLFADGRIESLIAPGAAASPSGTGTPIRTPDSVGGQADPAAGPNLPAAQARFPITGRFEMRGDGFAGMPDDQVRREIAARLAAEAAAQPAGQGWLPHFRRAFDRPDGSAAELITFDRIMLAIAEYQRSAVFVKSPWQRYVLGENAAISTNAKRGALSFYRSVAEGGANCVQCHRGDFFTDERFHPVGFPQTGPGFAADGSDFGRERVSGAERDRIAFRTPSLLNVERTGPYGHAGNYGSLRAAVAHYGNTEGTVQQQALIGEMFCFGGGYSQWSICRETGPDALRNSNHAIAQMQGRRLLDPADAMPVLNPEIFSLPTQDHLITFLESLTDPCVTDRQCLARWIPRPDEAPDAHQLNAVDREGRLR